MTSEKNSSTISPFTKTSKVWEKCLIVDLTLPGFNYLGPGNRTENGPPTNSVDAVAKKHDEAYDRAIDDFKKSHDLKQCVGEIKQADMQFLKDMVKIKATTAKEALGKVVGLTGISMKAVVEKWLGYTVYPSFKKIEKQIVAEIHKKDSR